AAQKKQENDKKKRNVAIAVPVSIVGALILGLVIFFLIKYQRKRKSLRPRIFDAEPKLEVGFTPYTDHTHQNGDGNTVLSYNGRPTSSGDQTIPTSPTDTKASEAMRLTYLSTENGNGRFSQAGSSSGNPSSPGRPTSRFLEEDELVIQHTD